MSERGEEDSEIRTKVIEEILLLFLFSMESTVSLLIIP